LLPVPDTDPTVRAHAAAEILLDRYGIVTRGSALAEDVPGGFAGVYRVLAAMEESGRIRRGYFVEGLGAAQFADAGAVDRLRAMAPKPGEVTVGDGTHWPDGPSHEPAEALVLAAADPANPYGAALAWPDPLGAAEEPGHRPSRRAGAMVCLVAGAPVFYIERGGRTVLTFAEEPEALRAAAFALSGVVAAGRLDDLTITTIDGASIHGLNAAAARALRDAGFSVTPRGLRLRAGQASSWRPETGSRNARG
jgi:ATP-dependent Lhr-like helicase